MMAISNSYSTCASAELSYWRSFSSEAPTTLSQSSFASGGALSTTHEQQSNKRSVRFSNLPNRLYTLITEHKWDDAIVRCFQNAEEARTWYDETSNSNKSSSREEEEQDRQQLAIHAALSSCSASPPKSLIKILIEANRESLKLVNHSNQIPLHLALVNGMDDDILLLLIKSCRESCKIVNHNGSLPIHLAAEYGASAQVINLLIKYYPAGLTKVDGRTNRTPLAIAQSANHCYRDVVIKTLKVRSSSRGRRASPMGIARSSSRSSSAGSVRSHASGISTYYYSNSSSNTTKVTKKSSAVNADSSIFSLINHKEWSLVEQRCKSRPEEASMWFEKRKKSDRSLSWRLLPLHRACELRPPVSTVEALIEAYPMALTEKDHSGRHPLHSACRKRARVEVIALLISGYKNALKIPDDKDRLPIHVACEYSPSRELFKLLIQSYPGSKNEVDGRGRTPLDIIRETGLQEEDDVSIKTSSSYTSSSNNPVSVESVVHRFSLSEISKNKMESQASERTRILERFCPHASLSDSSGVPALIRANSLQLSDESDS